IATAAARRTSTTRRSWLTALTSPAAGLVGQSQSVGRRSVAARHAHACPRRSSSSWAPVDALGPLTPGSVVDVRALLRARHTFYGSPSNDERLVSHALPARDSDGSLTETLPSSGPPALTDRAVAAHHRAAIERISAARVRYPGNRRHRERQRGLRGP